MLSINVTRSRCQQELSFYECGSKFSVQADVQAILLLLSMSVSCRKSPITAIGDHHQPIDGYPVTVFDSIHITGILS